MWKNATEQEKTDNVYLWLANTKSDYQRVVEMYKRATEQYPPDVFKSDGVRVVWTASMLYDTFYCGRRTGDNVFYTLPRIKEAVKRIMDL